MSLALLLALPFIGSAVAALMPANARNAESTWSAVIALVTLVQVALLFPEVRGGAVIREDIAWLPDAGLALVLRIDGFAWMFAMLISGIGLLVVLYARYYMSPADPVPRFFSFLLAFMGSMLGLVVAGNLIEIVFFWELTSLSSFVLIGYWHHRADARNESEEETDAGAAADGADRAAPLLARRQQGSEIGADDLAIHLLDREQDLGDAEQAHHDRDEAKPVIEARNAEGEARRPAHRR